MIELELLEGPAEAVFSLARAVLCASGGRLRLHLAEKAPHGAWRRAVGAAPRDATAGQALAACLARAGEALERALPSLDRRKPKACRTIARTLRRIADAGALFAADDAQIRALADEALRFRLECQYAEQYRRLARKGAGVDFTPRLVDARAAAQRRLRAVEFELFRLSLLQAATRAPHAGVAGTARVVAAQRLDLNWSAVATAASQSERIRALADLASAVRAAAHLYPRGQQRALRRLVGEARSAYGAADRAQETCALAAEAAAGQGAAAARAAGFIAGAAAAEAAAHLAAAPSACDALLAAPRYWREDQQC